MDGTRTFYVASWMRSRWSCCKTWRKAIDEFRYGCGSAAIATVLAAAMLAALELGYRLGTPRARTVSEALRSHINSVQASLLGLLTLIIGFTFSVALQHFDARSIAVVSEANAIGTTWLRSEMLNPDSRVAVRDLLRRYVDTRMEKGGRHSAELNMRDSTSR